MHTQYSTLRLILGDQLNGQHSWFSKTSSDTLYVLMEIRQETDYVVHHIQKIVAFFTSMRNFAAELSASGHEVKYICLDDLENTHSLTGNIQQLLDKYAIECFEYMDPDEFRLHKQLEEYCQELPIQYKRYSSEHFLCTKEAFQEFFAGKRQHVMETFYRHMRREYDLLMEGDQPVGKQWNFDGENRKKLPKGHGCPAPLGFSTSVAEQFEMIRTMGIIYQGEIDPENFIWPTSRKSSLELLAYFLRECLENFGKYQDAMSTESWSTYHARLSFSLNSKMISPIEVVQAAIKHWEERNEDISLAQIEGFIRQVIGWREYMRGIYWKFMPSYSEKNFFGHTRSLPKFYWTGDTKMHCLKHAIRQSLTYSYAHHIQRLMVTGNFALLAGVSPDEVDAWYLGIYIDAIEWVEVTNTRGMSQYADGGIVGTKPYISSANYIHKMSDYCPSCHYNHKIKVGEVACPFNSLYWNFFETHREKLQSNPRVGMMYKVWDKMDTHAKTDILSQAEKYLNELGSL